MKLTGKALLNAKAINLGQIADGKVPTDGEIYAALAAYMGTNAEGLAKMLWEVPDDEADTP